VARPMGEAWDDSGICLSCPTSSPRPRASVRLLASRQGSRCVRCVWDVRDVHVCDYPGR
jgi:hypothetical protein